MAIISVKIYFVNCIDSLWGQFINSSKIYEKYKFESIKQYLQIITKSTNISKECEQSIYNTFKGLDKWEDWSFQMINSWGSFPPKGFMSGSFVDFGDYDNCLSITPNEVIGESQYCLIDISFPMRPMNKNQNLFHRVDVLPEYMNKSGNNVFVKLSKEASYFYFYSLKLGICAPNKCNENDMKSMTEKGLKFYKQCLELRRNKL